MFVAGKKHAGQLRHRLEIQVRTSALSSNRGVESGVFETVGTVWGSIETISGAELEEARKTVAQATHAIVIRFYSGFTPRHRIKFGSRIFNIGHVDDLDNRGRFHVLTCREEV